MRTRNRFIPTLLGALALTAVTPPCPAQALPRAPDFYGVYWKPEKKSVFVPRFVSIRLDYATSQANVVDLGPVKLRGSSSKLKEVGGMALDSCGRLWSSGDGPCPIKKNNSPHWHHNECLFRFSTPFNGVFESADTLIVNGWNVGGNNAMASLPDGRLLIQDVHAGTEVQAFDPMNWNKSPTRYTPTSIAGRFNGLAYTHATPGYYYGIDGNNIIYKVPMTSAPRTPLKLSGNIGLAECLTAEGTSLFTVVKTGTKEELVEFDLGSRRITRRYGLARPSSLGVGRMAALVYNFEHVDLGGRSAGGRTTLTVEGKTPHCLDVCISSAGNRHMPGVLFVSVVPLTSPHFVRIPVFGGTFFAGRGQPIVEIPFTFTTNSNYKRRWSLPNAKDQFAVVQGVHHIPGGGLSMSNAVMVQLK